MANVFLSYDHEDRPRVIPIVQSLQSNGVSVFWDRHIPTGEKWNDLLIEHLASASCIVVAWSYNSIKSEWVIREASEGLKRHILAPLFLDYVNPPDQFSTIQAADLTSWRLGQISEEFDGFLMDVRSILSGHAHKIAIAPTCPGKIIVRCIPSGYGESLRFAKFRKGEFHPQTKVFSVGTTLTDAVSNMWQACLEADASAQRKVVVPNGFTSVYFRLEFRGNRFLVNCERTLNYWQLLKAPFAAEEPDRYRIDLTISSDDKYIANRIVQNWKTKSPLVKVISEQHFEGEDATP